MRERNGGAWPGSLARTALFLAGATLAGALADKPWPALGLAALAVAGWQFWRLRAVLRRLESRQRI